MMIIKPNIFFMQDIYKYIVVLYVALFSSALCAQTRRALVIGLGQQLDKSWGKINGDRDVLYITEFLKNAGFRKKNIRKLVNQQASKNAIENAFINLASESKRGDIIYVHFSGHGQQMQDLHNDELDGLDECWIPYDAYRKSCDEDRGEKHLTDDEVNYYMNMIRDKVGNTGKILVVVDACHSGSATREGEKDVVRGVEEIFEAIKSYLWKTSEVTKKAKIVNPNARQNKERWITISACESDQVNIEMKNPAVGKLTYAIYKEMKENDKCNNEEFFRRIKMFINKNTKSQLQNPVMTGETNRYKVTDIIQ